MQGHQTRGSYCSSRVTDDGAASGAGKERLESRNILNGERTEFAEG